jgi:hypothetical protein
VAGYKVKVMLAEPKTKRRNAGSPEMMYHMHQVSQHVQITSWQHYLQGSTSHLCCRAPYMAVTSLQAAKLGEYAAGMDQLKLHIGPGKLLLPVPGEESCSQCHGG